MGGRKVCFILLVAVVLMNSCRAQDPSNDECMKKCITDCANSGGTMCIVGCSVQCHWPFADTTEFEKFEAEAQKQHMGST